jgi:type II secretory pathway pseudopilin PulG
MKEYSMSLTANRIRREAINSKAGPAGFTIVELLVVIAVVMVLMALLFPVISMAREYAKRTVCISNLRQIGISIGTYAGDHRMRLPGIYHYNVSGPWGMYDNDNLSALYPDYTRELGIFICPATRNKVESRRDLERSAMTLDGRGSSYEYINAQTVTWGMSRGGTASNAPLVYDTDNRGNPHYIDADDNHAKIISGGMLFPDGTVDWVYEDEWHAAIYDNIPLP